MTESVNIAWTDYTSTPRNVDIYPHKIKWSVSGSNEQVVAPTIQPYIVVLGYNNPKIDLTFTTDSAGNTTLQYLLPNDLTTVTSSASYFPEFGGASIEWYVTDINLSRNQGFGTDRFDGNMTLLRNYG